MTLMAESYMVMVIDFVIDLRGKTLEFQFDSLVCEHDL